MGEIGDRRDRVIRGKGPGEGGNLGINRSGGAPGAEVEIRIADGPRNIPRSNVRRSACDEYKGDAAPARILKGFFTASALL